jgi:type II secretion system protein H
MGKKAARDKASTLVTGSEMNLRNPIASTSKSAVSPVSRFAHRESICDLGAPDLSGSQPNRTAHCRLNPAFRASAFTLIELMIVVALIGIMTAVILPEMKGTFEDALLRSTSRELIDAFSVAHSRAVSFNQPHRVRLDAHGGHFIVEKRVRERGGEEFAPVHDVPGSDGKLDTRILVDVRSPGSASTESAPGSPSESENETSTRERRDVITFYPDGTADAREVLLEDRQGFRLVLRINPTTAHIRVAELARR